MLAGYLYWAFDLVTVRMQEKVSKQDAILAVGLGSWRLKPLMAPVFECLGAELEGAWRHLPMGSLQIESLPEVCICYSCSLTHFQGAKSFVHVFELNQPAVPQAYKRMPPLSCISPEPIISMQGWLNIWKAQYLKDKHITFAKLMHFADVQSRLSRVLTTATPLFWAGSRTASLTYDQDPSEARKAGHVCR